MSGATRPRLEQKKDRRRPDSSRSLSFYISVILGVGALVLVALAILTAIRAEDMNRIAMEARQEDARDDLTQAVRALVADSRAILREVALWDKTRKQLENPVYYQFWWRNRLMNPARVPHYVHWMEMYTANGESLSEIKETPLPQTITGAGAYSATLDELPRLADDAMYRARYSNGPKIKIYGAG